MSWTPEREAEARRLWTAGESAFAIARQLGGVSRNAVLGKIHRMGLGREPVRAEPKPVCAVPGCGKVLSEKNASGVCMVHNHAVGLCRCPACKGQVFARRADPVERPNVRVVEVPYSTSNSGVALRARISLPREPWLMGTTT